MEQKIFLLRHAKKEGGPGDISLSSDGRIQAKRLAKKILNELRGKNVTIWTSSAMRAQETAIIIKDEIKDEVSVTDFLTVAKLWSDNDHPYDFKWLKESINQFKEGNLIIISHLEYVREFPGTIGFRENNAGNAQGVLIENGKCFDFE